MYGHGSFGANKYGGLIQTEIIIVTITVISKIPALLLTSIKDKNVVYFKKGENNILTTASPDKTIL